MLIRVQKQISDNEQSDTANKGIPAQSGPLEIKRGSNVVSILPNIGATSLALSFKWLGRSKADEERGDFQLLDDLHSAVVRTCSPNESRITVQRRCSARPCKHWQASKSHTLDTH